jgi:hypothetical protein
MSAGGGDERMLREAGGGIMLSVGSIPSWMAGSDAGIVASDEISVSSGYFGVSAFLGKDTSEGKLACDEDVVGLPLPSSEVGWYTNGDPSEAVLRRGFSFVNVSS